MVKPVLRRVVPSFGFEHSRLLFGGAKLLVDLVQHTVEALVVLAAVRAVLRCLFPLTTAIHFTRGAVSELMADKLSLQIGPAFVATVPNRDRHFLWVIPSAPPWTLELF